jgi:hypothetical protein
MMTRPFRDAVRRPLALMDFRAQQLPSINHLSFGRLEGVRCVICDGQVAMRQWLKEVQQGCANGDAL